MSETHKEHPSPTKYVQIAIVLAILTAIEVALYYTEDIVGALAAPLLIILAVGKFVIVVGWFCLLYTSPSPRDATLSRMPSSA